MFIRFFIAALFFPVFAFAQSLRYGVVEFNPVTPAQANAAPGFIDGLLSGYDVKVVSYEYTPAADVEDLAQNTFRMSIALNSTLAEAQSLLQAIRNAAESRGITVTVQRGTNGLVTELGDCLQTYGTNIINRPPLKACALAAYRANRVMTPEDNARFKQVLADRGFNSFAELRAWLNETP